MKAESAPSRVQHGSQVNDEINSNGSIYVQRDWTEVHGGISSSFYVHVLQSPTVACLNNE